MYNLGYFGTRSLLARFVNAHNPEQTRVNWGPTVRSDFFFRHFMPGNSYFIFLHFKYKRVSVSKVRENLFIFLLVESDGCLVDA